MKNFNYMNISILLLLLVSKLSSSFINISPFIATIIIGSYFINSKYHLLIMICIAQFISDMSFGMHISSIFVYMSYFCIVPILYVSEKNFSLVNSLIKSHDTNFKGIGQPLRIALTGSKFGPGIYDIIVSLGKEEVLKRLGNKIFI